jgi:hypothetical protein
MRVSKTLAAATALSMAATPAVAASANPAAKLSLAGTNVHSPAAEAAPEARRSGGHTYLLVGLGILGIVALAVAMGGNGDGISASA